MDICELQQIDNYVDSILKNVNINKMLEILDMDEMDRYVDTILGNVPVHANNIMEDYEVIDLKREPTIYRKIYRKKKSNECSVQ